MAKQKKFGRPGPELPAAYKLAAVQERLRGTSEADVAKAFGVSTAAVAKWSKLFREKGPAGLESRRAKANATRKAPNAVKRERVVALKQQNDNWGTRRIRDVLARFEALGVSEQEVRRILHGEGMIETPRPKAPEHGPRRFERATPNQLWQSDIFPFRLRRTERLYVCVFMDDHSRFIVGYAMAHHQKSALVMEAFERGVASYGQPTEVLTDNGRQYTVWRGRTEFEETLTRMGIQHIRSRPQHPQTLGKVERFWKTLWDEFLGRTVFAHVVDAQHRLDHFISHYNFQRPHQALDGLVPADRFFKAAAHVRAEIERAVAANELRLALEQPPRKPFYVVGQLGDQRLSISAGDQGLQVHVGDTTQTIPLKEQTDGATTARQFAEETAEETQERTEASMAHRQDGSRRGRTQSSADVSVGHLRREDGDGRDRGEQDFAEPLLPARDQGAQRDAVGARAGLGWRSEYRRGGVSGSDQGARGQAAARGAGTTTSGATAPRPSEAECGPGEESAAWTTSDEANLLDANWAERLALLDDDDDDARAEDAHLAQADECDDETLDFGLDPNDWRDLGPERWERKLAGADALSDRLVEDDDAQGTPADVHPSAGIADRSRSAQTLRRDHVGTRTEDRGHGGSQIARDVAQSLSDDPASVDCGDHRSDHTEACGSTSEATEGGRARSGERAADGTNREPDGTGGDDRASDGRSDFDIFWEGAIAQIARAIEENEAERRRSGTGETIEVVENDPTVGDGDE